MSKNAPVRKDELKSILNTLRNYKDELSKNKNEEIIKLSMKLDVAYIELEDALQYWPDNFAAVIDRDSNKIINKLEN